MESLQLSQVLADLSNLGAAEPEAASAIVAANTSITITTPASKTEPAGTPQSQRSRPSALQRSWSFEPNSQPKFDKYGRRIMTSSPGSRSGSIPGTPRANDYTLSDDLERASTLMALYEIRDKLKQQDNSSLIKAREKVNALAAKQQQPRLSARQPDSQLRGHYPTSRERGPP
ncbi:hypothetical protein B0I35DRAFT_27572 [Stachybotrys elegans]|uniref:Uncharacterized protein n=1 Tax=Stachybotrys elegans TaxID=80388 RepID=A0A8K0WX34_9HYPO|nr:hypothetical protein B0I35DRAFT_27572 [Stachybotrys elegans]